MTVPYPSRPMRLALVAALALVVACGGSGTESEPLAPPLPPPESRLDRLSGPGLGNLSYGADELFSAVSFVDETSGVPTDSPGKPYGTNAAAIFDGYLFTVFAPDSGAGPGGLLFHDVSDPRAVRLVNRVYEPGGRTREFREAHALGFGIVEGRRYVAMHSGRGLEMWDLTDILEPIQAGKLALDGVDFGDYQDVAWQLFWAGRHVYVASANRGLFIVDVSDPRDPVLADRGGRPNPVPISELGGFRIGPVFVVGNLMVFTGMNTNRGYATLDLSDPVNPRLRATLTRGLEQFYASSFNGNRIIGSARGFAARMTVHDVSDPDRIRLVNDELVVDEQLYNATQDEFVFQGNQSDVAKIDISDPARYRIVGRGSLDRHDPDHGQVTPMANLVYVGNDHGTGSGFIVHQREPDTRPPRVNMVMPAEGASDLARTSRVGLTFTDSVELVSVNETTFLVRPEGGSPLSGRYTVQLATVNFEPDETLAPGTRYEVIVPAGGITDWAGNATDEEFRSSFVTARHRAPDTPDPALIAHWRFDTASGDVAIDASGNGFHASLEGGARLGIGALELDGQRAAVRVSDSALNLDGDFSVSLWVKSSSTSRRGPDNAQNWWRGEWLVDRDALGRSVGWALTHHHGKLKFYVNEDMQTLVSSTAIDDGTWHHVAATRRASDGRRRLYVDGRLEASAMTGSTASIAHGHAFHLGSNSLVAGFATAALRDVRIFSRELGDDEVEGFSRGGGNPPLTADLVRPEATPVGAATHFRIDVLGADDSRIRWDFGDGTDPVEGAAGETIPHTYGAPGHYEVIASLTSESFETGVAFTHTVHRPTTVESPTRSSTLAYDAARDQVWVVNADNDSVTAIDVGALTKHREVPVGRHPRTLALAPDGRLWIAIQDDAAVVVLDGNEARVQHTIALPRGSRPYGVTLDPSGSAVFVTLAGTGQLVKLNPVTGEVLGRAQLGPRPRGIAITHDGARALVTRFISPDERGEVYVIDTASMTVVETIALARDDTTEDSQDRGRGLPNYLSALTITPDGAEAWVPSKSDNVLRGLVRDGQPLNHENTLRAITSRIDLASSRELPGTRIDFDDRNMATAVEFSPLGDYAYVALLGSNLLEIRDAFSGGAVGGIDRIGLTPQGLASTPDGSRLFVHGLMSRSVAVFDVAAVSAARDFAPRRLALISTVADERLSAAVLRGKQLFYEARDSRLSRDGYISCASCHLDGGQDGRVWDFTDRGEGLRNTITLKGRRGMGHGPVHWSGNFDEIQDFENDIRGPFGGTGLMSNRDFEATSNPLGAPKSGRSADLDALAAYVASLDEIPASPHRSESGALTSKAMRGRDHFAMLECANCHAGEQATDSALDLRHDVGTLTPDSGGRLGASLLGIDTPTLRGVWNTAPYLHDGSAATLGDVLTQRNRGELHGDLATLTDEQLDELIAYLRQRE